MKSCTLCFALVSINQQWFTTPEPSSFVLLGSAIGTLGLIVVRGRRSVVATSNK